MSAIFLPEDVCELLKGKTVIYIGDSVQRSMYKDLVLLFQEKRYLTDQELRAKGELCFLGDELMEGGRKGEMTNSTKYREVRKFLFDSQTKVLYFFITACFGDYIEMVLKKLMKPDIIFMNSCLWDVHRYGTKGYEGYGPNLKKLVRLLKELHPTVLFAWTTTPPVDIKSKAGFLEDRKDLVKINEVLRCNDIARQIMSQEDIPIADFADVFRHFTHHRANDGVHWNERAHRRMTNILLETVARHLNRPVPRPVGDDFNRNIDFDDRPPFPHSYSQPAFHHNDSWGSVDEYNWYNDPFMNDSTQDDFILGLDRSYGYGNYSYYEMEEEMSPRFMPPPGRRMPPPPMRGPPLPPGYRFGTGDPGMWEGRKRKGWDDDVPDGYSKRQYAEENRRYQGSHGRRTTSPMVDGNKPKFDEAQKSLSPELDEKPAALNSTAAASEKAAAISPPQTENHNDVDIKSPVGDIKGPLVEGKPVEEEKAAFSQEVGGVEMGKPNIETGSVRSDKNSLHQAVPNEERKPVADVPSGLREEKNLDNKVNVEDEMRGLDTKVDLKLEKPAGVPEVSEEKSSDSVHIPESDDKVSEAKKASVFDKLSSTTAMILQSIQKSSKPVTNVAQTNDRPLDVTTQKTNEDLADEKGDKMEESVSTGVVLDEKPSIDVRISDTSVATAGRDILSPSAESAATENVGKDELEPSVSIVEDAAKAEAKTISYYDVEDTLDDIEASLDKMDDDVLMETLDIDEESLLLDETADHLSTPGPTNGVSKMDLDVMHQKTVEGSLKTKDEPAGEKEIYCRQGSNNSVAHGQLFGSLVSIANSPDSKTLNGKSELNIGGSADGNDSVLAFQAQKSMSESEKDLTKGLIVRPENQNETSGEGTRDTLVVVTSTENLFSSSNAAIAKVDVLAASTDTQRPQPPKSLELLKPKGTPRQQQNPIVSVSPSEISRSITSTKPIVMTSGSGSAAKGHVSPVIKATTVSSGTESATVPFVTKGSTLSGNTNISATSVSKATSFVAYSAKAGQPVPVATNNVTSSLGPVTTLSSENTSVPIGKKPPATLSTSLKTTATISLRNTGSPIGTKTVTVPLGTKTAPIATPGLSKSGICNTSESVVSSSSNAPASLGPKFKAPSSTPLALVDTKPKIPCVPNPPSLDMKSPFFKPELTTKAPNLIGSPSKSSLAKVSETSTNSNPEGHPPQENPEPLTVHSAEKSAGATGNVTPSKKKAKVKKKKKIGKKGSKKAGKDGVENSDAGLKGVKSGGIKKKTKKDGKIKKKKLKNKLKNKELSADKSVVKSAENISQNATPNTQNITNNEQRNITIIASKDRSKSRQQQNDAVNRNTQFHNQNIPSPNVNAINNFVPQAHQTFQQQQQQQPLGSTPQYFSNQQTFVAISPPPQVASVPQFPYVQQVFTNQSNTLGYATGFGAFGTNAMFGMSPAAMSAGYQQVDYYSSQAGNQVNRTNLHGSMMNPAQSSKEYEHLAWL